jgi:hypothetical protein
MFGFWATARRTLLPVSIGLQPISKPASLRLFASVPSFCFRYNPYRIALSSLASSNSDTTRSLSLTQTFAAVEKLSLLLKTHPGRIVAAICESFGRLLLGEFQ